MGGAAVILPPPPPPAPSKKVEIGLRNHIKSYLYKNITWSEIIGFSFNETDRSVNICQVWINSSFKGITENRLHLSFLLSPLRKVSSNVI